jgi:hypothetical protein
MYDDPDLKSLLQAVRDHLEANVIPAVRSDNKLYFQTLVAVNVLTIGQRELEHQQEHAYAEWESLNQLDGSCDPPPDSFDELKSVLTKRNADLALAIRRGDYDQKAEKLARYLQQCVVQKLQVANPRFLKRIMTEQTNRDLDAWENR